MNLQKIKINWTTVFSFRNLLLLLLFYSSLYLFSFASINGGGLDSSWMYGLNWVIKNHLVFGKDIIFTFGPLAYLETHFILYTNKIVFIVFSMVYVFQLNYIAYDILKRYTKKLPQIVIALAFFHLFQIGISISLTILPIIFFFLFSYLEKQKKIYLVATLLWSVLIFFIKLNSGLVASLFFFFGIGYFLVTKRLSIIFFLLLILIYGLSIYSLSCILYVDLPNYILNVLEIIKGYNYAMAFLYVKPVFLALFNLGLFVVYILFTYKKSLFDKDNLFKLILLMGGVFILFKNGFVRADWHQIQFYLGQLFFTLLLVRFFDAPFTIKTTVLVALPLFFSLILGTFMPVDFPIRFIHFPSIFNNQNSWIVDTNKERQLPNSVLNTIGRHTVDVIPTEILFTYYNNLNYCPRPIFQSYSTYTPVLDSINYRFFLGKKSPEFILFNVGSIDRRYIFGDESFTKLALYKNYIPIETYHLPKFMEAQRIAGATIKDSIDLIVLKKREAPLKMAEKIVLDTLVHIDSVVYLKKSNTIQYLYADIQYTILGKIQSLVFQPITPMLKLTYSDNSSTIVGTPSVILQNGILINKRVQSNAEAYCVFSQNYEKMTDVKTFSFVKKYTFGIQKYIHIKIKEFTFK